MASSMERCFPFPANTLPFCLYPRGNARGRPKRLLCCSEAEREPKVFVPLLRSIGGGVACGVGLGSVGCCYHRVLRLQIMRLFTIVICVPSHSGPGVRFCYVLLVVTAIVTSSTRSTTISTRFTLSQTDALICRRASEPDQKCSTTSLQELAASPRAEDRFWVWTRIAREETTKLFSLYYDIIVY